MISLVSYFRCPALGLLIFLLLLLIPTPIQAATIPPERTTLTLELLQERLNFPIQSEGFSTIDLRQLIIDLTNENGEFREQFYQRLQTQINRSKTPLGIDLSESLIQGEFIASKWGMQTSLSQAGLSSLLSPAEQEQLQTDNRFLTKPGEQIPLVTVFRGPLKFPQARFTGIVNFANTFFLQRVEASQTTFIQEVNYSNTRFAKLADFTHTTFGREVNFSSSIFFDNAKFSQTQFLGTANFTGSTFHNAANFLQAEFTQLANFSRSQWFQTADFREVSWRDRTLLNKSHFTQSLLLTNATLEKSTTFRETRFQQPVVLQDVSLLDQVDFSSARFGQNAYLNVAGMTFDSNLAKILGDTGRIGRVFSVPKLQDNEDVLRNLVRNFRSQQQIPDANQLEYTTQRLRRQQLRHDLLGNSRINPFSASWLLDASRWFGLSIILLLSQDGTSFRLVFGVGMVAIAFFGLLFWLIDRWRRRYPQPILPTYGETTYMLGSFTVVTVTGIITIFRAGEQPWLTLLCLGGILLPVPLVLVWQLYQQGRYHDLLNVSYFVEDGSLRQLHLLIGRLPIMPRFAIFRDRYLPILWERRWSWLNYYDFSLNNLLKFGFNDIRLRDEHLPGIITTLAWYQWSLGILYIALLLWTLSRTIPGLNLFIYL